MVPIAATLLPEVITYSRDISYSNKYLQQQFYLLQKLYYLQQQCSLQQCPAATCVAVLLTTAITYSSKAHCDNIMATIPCHNASGKFFIHQSRHMVVCQQPREMCSTQVPYVLQEPLSYHFRHLISHIYITTEPISIKFAHFMHSVYTTSHSNFEGNRSSSL